MDLLAIVIVAFLFALSAAYLHGCERLKGPRP